MDTALASLSASYPDFDPTSCLIKAAAINQFYGTNVYELPAVANHISTVMTSGQAEDLVEALATVSLQGKTTRYVSFASKFAHFFVDETQFPIVDSYARTRLLYHLSGVSLPDPPKYADYVAAHRALIDLAALGCSGRALDRYLWLSGLHDAWARGERRINVEVRTLLDGAAVDSDVLRELRALCESQDQ